MAAQENRKFPFGIFETTDGKLIFPSGTPAELKKEARQARKDGHEFLKAPVNPGFDLEEIPLGIYIGKDEYGDTPILPFGSQGKWVKFVKEEYRRSGKKYFPSKKEADTFLNLPKEKVVVPEDRSKPEPRESFDPKFAREEIGRLPNQGRPANEAPPEKEIVEEPSLYQGRKETDPPKEAQIKEAVGQNPAGGSIYSIRTTLRAKHPEAASLLETDPVQRKLYDETRIDNAFKPIFKEGLDPRLQAYAKDAIAEDNGKSPFGIFPAVGQTWEDLVNRYDNFFNIRVNDKNKLEFPEKISEQDKQIATKLSDGFYKNTGERYFRKPGETWDQYEDEFGVNPLRSLPEAVKTIIKESPIGRVGLAGDLGGKPATPLNDILAGTEGEQKDLQLLSPEQIALQNLLINQATGQVGQLGVAQTLPKPPTLPGQPTLPNLNFNYPGYGQPQYQPPGYSALSPLLQKGGSFAPIEEAARYSFETEKIPTLAERFGNFGGAGRSSAYGRAMAGAREKFEREIAAMRAQSDERAADRAFQQQSEENRQQLALQQLQNQLSVGQNAQQLEREKLQNELTFGSNTQQLAAQEQASRQALNQGEAASKLYGLETGNQLNAATLAQQGQLGTLNAALSSRVQPNYQPGSPGLLQTLAEQAIPTATRVGLGYLSGKPF